MLSLLTVLRAVVAPGLSGPVQHSQTMQLAINNVTHLTIMEPRLPLLHRCLAPKKSVPVAALDASQGAPLDSSVFYEVTSVFEVENLSRYGFLVFSNILLREAERRFGFSRINDPSIVSHAWSEVDPVTRDCYLGVLLNTGEVFVLKRESLDRSSYKVVFRSFSVIMDSWGVGPENLSADGEMILNAQQWLELKVTSFSFGPQHTVCVAHESGQISVYTLEGVKVAELGSEGYVTKQIWAGTRLYYVMADNSVHGCEFEPDFSGLRHHAQVIKPASRFLISQLAWAGRLVVVDPASLHLVDLDFEPVSLKLPYRATVVSLPVAESETAFTCAVCYETGHVLTVEIPKVGLGTSELELSSPELWRQFRTEVLQRYADSLARDQARATSDMFKPYAEECPEASMTLYGVVPSLGGSLAVVYGMAPKGLVSHVTMVGKKFTVGFMPSLLSGKASPDPQLSTLAAVNNAIMAHLHLLPTVDKGVVDGEPAAVEQFVGSVDKWNTTLQDSLPDADVHLTYTPQPTLVESLVANLQQSTAARRLQQRFVLNLAAIQTLEAVKAKKAAQHECVDKQLVQLAEQQDSISSALRLHLAQCVRAFEPFESPTDQFILATFAALQGVQMDAALTIFTDLCTETFQTTSTSENFLKYAQSTSGHAWPRCDRSLLPIMELTNQADELQCHNYTAQSSDAAILEAFRKTINHCLFTGTRTFNIKIGV